MASDGIKYKDIPIVVVYGQKQFPLSINPSIKIQCLLQIVSKMSGIPRRFQILHKDNERLKGKKRLLTYIDKRNFGVPVTLILTRRTTADRSSSDGQTDSSPEKNDPISNEASSSARSEARFNTAQQSSLNPPKVKGSYKETGARPKETSVSKKGKNVEKLPKIPNQSSMRGRSNQRNMSVQVSPKQCNLSPPIQSPMSLSQSRATHKRYSLSPKQSTFPSRIRMPSIGITDPAKALWYPKPNDDQKSFRDLFSESYNEPSTGLYDSNVLRRLSFSPNRATVSPTKFDAAAKRYSLSPKLSMWSPNQYRFPPEVPRQLWYPGGYKSSETSPRKTPVSPEKLSLDFSRLNMNYPSMLEASQLYARFPSPEHPSPDKGGHRTQRGNKTPHQSPTSQMRSPSPKYVSKWSPVSRLRTSQYTVRHPVSPDRTLWMLDMPTMPIKKPTVSPIGAEVKEKTSSPKSWSKLRNKSGTPPKCRSKSNSEPDLSIAPRITLTPPKESETSPERVARQSIVKSIMQLISPSGSPQGKSSSEKSSSNASSISPKKVTFNDVPSMIADDLHFPPLELSISEKKSRSSSKVVSETFIKPDSTVRKDLMTDFEKFSPVKNTVLPESNLSITDSTTSCLQPTKEPDLSVAPKPPKKLAEEPDSSAEQKPLNKPAEEPHLYAYSSSNVSSTSPKNATVNESPSDDLHFPSLVLTLSEKKSLSTSKLASKTFMKPASVVRKDPMTDFEKLSPVKNPVLPSETRDLEDDTNYLMKSAESNLSPAESTSAHLKPAEEPDLSAEQNPLNNLIPLKKSAEKPQLPSSSTSNASSITPKNVAVNDLPSMIADDHHFPPLVLSTRSSSKVPSKTFIKPNSTVRKDVMKVYENLSPVKSPVLPSETHDAESYTNYLMKSAESNLSIAHSIASYLKPTEEPDLSAEQNPLKSVIPLKKPTEESHLSAYLSANASSISPKNVTVSDLSSTIADTLYFPSLVLSSRSSSNVTSKTFIKLDSMVRKDIVLGFEKFSPVKNPVSPSGTHEEGDTNVMKSAEPHLPIADSTASHMKPAEDPNLSAEQNLPKKLSEEPHLSAYSSSNASSNSSKNVIVNELPFMISDDHHFPSLALSSSEKKSRSSSKVTSKNFIKPDSTVRKDLMTDFEKFSPVKNPVLPSETHDSEDNTNSLRKSPESNPSIAEYTASHLKPAEKPDLSSEQNPVAEFYTQCSDEQSILSEKLSDTQESIVTQNSCVSYNEPKPLVEQLGSVKTSPGNPTVSQQSIDTSQGFSATPKGSPWHTRKENTSNVKTWASVVSGKWSDEPSTKPQKCDSQIEEVNYSSTENSDSSNKDSELSDKFQQTKKSP